MNEFFKYLLPQLLSYFGSEKLVLEDFIPKVIENHYGNLLLPYEPDNKENMEMRRIELLSESPSAPGPTIIVGNLNFPRRRSCRQDQRVSSFMNSLSPAKLRAKSSLRYDYTPDPESRSSGRDGCAKLGS